MLAIGLYGNLFRTQVVNTIDPKLLRGQFLRQCGGVPSKIFVIQNGDFDPKVVAIIGSPEVSTGKLTLLGVNMLLTLIALALLLTSCLTHGAVPYWYIFIPCVPSIIISFWGLLQR